MTKYVYDFSEGNKDMKDLLGGKGANLAEMTNMGLPVPHGFTITTEACLTFLARGRRSARDARGGRRALAALEEAMGKTLGDPDDPLLVVGAVRREVLDARHDGHGPEPRAERGLASRASRSRPGGDVRFARDAYRRFIQMFGKIVMDVPADAFEHALDEAKAREGRGRAGHRPRRRGPGRADRPVQGDLPRAHRRGLPAGPEGAAAPGDRRRVPSWNGKRAIDYRRQNKISDDLGTAVNVVGDGVRQPRRRLRHRRRVHPRPLDRREGPVRRLPGQRAGRGRRAGIRNTLPLAKLEELDPTSYAGCAR